MVSIRFTPVRSFARVQQVFREHEVLHNGYGVCFFSFSLMQAEYQFTISRD